MLQYDKIDALEGISINKINKSKECMLCHYWYLKDIAYKFQPYLCNGCHAVSIMTYKLEYIAILNVKVFIIGVFYGVLVEMRLLIG